MWTPNFLSGLGNFEEMIDPNPVHPMLSQISASA
jgi:hypothetical protein